MKQSGGANVSRVLALLYLLHHGRSSATGPFRLCLGFASKHTRRLGGRERERKLKLYYTRVTGSMSQTRTYIRLLFRRPMRNARCYSN